MTLEQIMILLVCRRKQRRQYSSPLSDRSESFLLSHSLSTASSIWTRRFRAVRRTVRHREREKLGRNFGINRFIITQKCSRLNHFPSRNKISYCKWCVNIKNQAKIHVLRIKLVVKYIQNLFNKYFINNKIHFFILIQNSVRCLTIHIGFFRSWTVILSIFWHQEVWIRCQWT